MDCSDLLGKVDIRRSPDQALDLLRRYSEAYPATKAISDFAFVLATLDVDLDVRWEALAYVSAQQLGSAAKSVIVDLTKAERSGDALRRLETLPHDCRVTCAESMGGCLALGNRSDLLQQFLSDKELALDLRELLAAGVSRLVDQLPESESKREVVRILWEEYRHVSEVGAMTVPFLSYWDDGAEADGAVRKIAVDILDCSDEVKMGIWRSLLTRYSNAPETVAHVLNHAGVREDESAALLATAIENVVASGDNTEGGAALISWLTEPKDREEAARQLGMLSCPRVLNQQEALSIMDSLGRDQRVAFVDGMARMPFFRQGVEIDLDAMRQQALKERSE